MESSRHAKVAAFQRWLKDNNVEPLNRYQLEVAELFFAMPTGSRAKLFARMLSQFMTENPEPLLY